MCAAVKTLVFFYICAGFFLPARASVSREDNDLNINQPKTSLVTALPSTSIIPHDIKVYILSHLSEQKDILRIGTVSKDWRQATAKVWEKRWLDLSNKLLTADHYTVLANGIFPRLRLNNVKLNEEGMNILATCSHLQALELHKNNLRATKSLIKLLSLSRLSHINVAFNQIGNEGADALVPSLKGMTALTTLYLAENQIGASGATALAPSLKGMTALTTLYLSSNKIGAIGATALAPSLQGMTALTELYLSWNQIGDEGATALAPSLKGMTVLTTLALSNNQIGAAGAMALAPSLKGMTALTVLYLHNNHIGDVGKKALEDVKRSRPSLSIHY